MGASHRQAAKTTGLTYGAVANRLYRAQRTAAAPPCALGSGPAPVGELPDRLPQVRQRDSQAWEDTPSLRDRLAGA